MDDNAHLELPAGFQTHSSQGLCLECFSSDARHGSILSFKCLNITFPMRSSLPTQFKVEKPPSLPTPKHFQFYLSSKHLYSEGEDTQISQYVSNTTVHSTGQVGKIITVTRTIYYGPAIYHSLCTSSTFYSPYLIHNRIKPAR